MKIQEVMKSAEDLTHRLVSTSGDLDDASFLKMYNTTDEELMQHLLMVDGLVACNEKQRTERKKAVQFLNECLAHCDNHVSIPVFSGWLLFFWFSL